MKAAPPLLAAAVLLASCADPLPVADTTAAVTVNGVEDVMPSEGPATANAPDDGQPARLTGAFVESDFLGRWVGVEGMTLDVAKADAAGQYRLTMQWSLDDRGTFDGVPQSSSVVPRIAFRRGGEDLTLRRTDGEATGLKYLAGKRDCLTVKPGEGYCRD